MHIDNTNCYRFLRDKAAYAIESRNLNLMYEAYGMAEMARWLGHITQEEFMDLNEKLVRNGINRPGSYDN